MYQLSKHHNWVDPTNKFAPFTWEIEGLKKPGKVSSNVPTDIMSKDQNQWVCLLNVLTVLMHKYPLKLSRLLKTISLPHLMLTISFILEKRLYYV